jgi:hypothetical protein
MLPDIANTLGYRGTIEALTADPNHPDHEDATEWFGDVDPNDLDEQSITDHLRCKTTARKPRKANRGDQLTLIFSKSIRFYERASHSS